MSFKDIERRKGFPEFDMSRDVLDQNQAYITTALSRGWFHVVSSWWFLWLTLPITCWIPHSLSFSFHLLPFLLLLSSFFFLLSSFFAFLLLLASPSPPFSFPFFFLSFFFPPFSFCRLSSQKHRDLRSCRITSSSVLSFFL